jgi:MauM/NapG family ferredoxin protein
VSDDEPLSKRGLLRLGLTRAGQAVGVAGEIAIDNMASRVTPHVARPPGALTEISFLLACTRCGECAKACPVNAILELDDRAGVAAGTPFLDVNGHRACVACDDAPCMPACPSGALTVIPMKDAVLGTAVVDRELCTSWTREGMCTSCFQACPFNWDAIVTDEFHRPYIDPRSCIGCGICRAACPVSPRAITVRLPPRF